MSKNNIFVLFLSALFLFSCSSQENENKNLNDGFDVLIASKEKALFDYLYLKFFRVDKITKSMLNDLRLNLDSFTKQEKRLFKEYCSLTQMNKYLSLYNLLFDESD